MSLLAQIDPILTPDVDWSGLMPLIILSLGAILLVTVRSVAKGLPAWFDAAWTIGIGIVTIIAVLPLWDRVMDDGAFNALGDQIGVDGFSLFLTVVIACSVVLTALLVEGYIEREQVAGPEMYVLLLLSAAGGVSMASANDLIVLFLGLETLSIAVYVMAAMHLHRNRSLEAGIKYFVLGAFSSAFLLYGIAFVYGATGSTNLIEISAFLDRYILRVDAMLLMGFGFMLVGLAFKIAAVPFHSWTPDVYQGSPTPVVGYMASGVKVAGFAALLRVFVVTFSQSSADWQPVVYALAVLSLIVGAVFAIVQRDVKRMLAYSSIAHAGFILLGVQAGSDDGTSAALFYLASYTFLVLGSFGVVSLVAGRGDSRTSLDDFDGLADRRPVLALAFTVFLLAQAGVPLTTGFVAKFEVITAAVDARSYWLAVVAMVSSVISAFLYLRIVLSMYAGTVPADDDRPRIEIPTTAAIAIGIAAAVTIGFGIAPGFIDDLARDAIPQLVAVAG